MKRTAGIILFVIIISQLLPARSFGMAQQDTTTEKTVKKELNVRVGNRGLSVLESLEGDKSVKLERYNENDTLYLEDEKGGANINPPDDIDRHYNNDADRDRENKREEKREYRESGRRRGFKGHWTGVELGFNNYTASRDNFAMPEDINYMTLHSGKSMNFNLNFAQANIGITRHFGFVFGPGLSWNNYRFDGNNNIIKGVNGIVEMFDPGVIVKKSKFSTIYMTMPFLFELQLPLNGTHMNIAAGPIGAVKLSSHSKIVYENGEKVKSDSDFSLNMLRYGATARVGFSNFQFFGTYYLTPLFQKGKSPGGHDLFPFEVGLALSFND